MNRKETRKKGGRIGMIKDEEVRMGEKGGREAIIACFISFFPGTTFFADKSKLCAQT